MIRPEHARWFFTVVLTLALAMSVPPQKAALRKQTDGYNLEQKKTRKSALIIPFVF